MQDATREGARGLETSRPSDGIWLALLLDGRGGASELDWDAVERWSPEHGPLWLHLDPRSPRAVRWLRERSGLSEVHLTELLKSERRPRLEEYEGAVLIALRGLAPELEGDSRELVLIHSWVERSRNISLCEEPLPGAEVARNRYTRREGPRDLPALVLWLASHLGTALQNSASDLEDPLVELEYAAELGHEDTSAKLHDLQGRVTRLRRHLAPFKVLIRRAIELEDSWLIQDHVKKWRSLADQAQDSDDLAQSVYERLSALHGYVDERLSRAMDRTLYRLTVYSTILLPLTFVTGLFGMNVGIRGASYAFMEGTLAFLIVTLILVAFGWLEYRIARKRRLLPVRAGVRPAGSPRQTSRGREKRIF